MANRVIIKKSLTKRELIEMGINTSALYASVAIHVYYVSYLAHQDLKLG